MIVGFAATTSGFGHAFHAWCMGPSGARRAVT
jgi:hypothetical protein